MECSSAPARETSWSPPTTSSQLGKNTNRYSLRVATVTRLPPAADPKRLWWLILPPSARTFRLNQRQLLGILEEPSRLLAAFDQAADNSH
jgi:hypothetical protein